MRILRGGSAEIKPNRWFKFDIELDQDDLVAIAVKNNLSVANFTVGQKYLTLVKQAEILTTIEMEAQGMSGDKTSRQLIAEFNDYISTLPKASDVISV